MYYKKRIKEKMESNNIIVFPKGNINIQNQQATQEEILQNIEAMKHYHVQETLSVLSHILFNHLEIAGFYSENDEDIKDGAFLLESIRSYMCKYYDIYHPFQQIAENVFSADKENITTLKIVDSLNIDLKNQEKNVM